MSRSFQIIQGAGDIDLRQHAVIEASAGTGKTYTMVALVLRLMSDEDSGLPLDKILITTFTDNAANELKSRIRQQLTQQLQTGDLSSLITKRFQKALQNIESAPIYTIHGFAQRMSREFAFESGEVFEQTLVDGDRVFNDRFNAFIRTWPGTEYLKTAFNDYLAADKKNSLTRLKTTVLQLAKQVKPDFDVIYPPKPEPLPDLEHISLMADRAELEVQFMQLHTNKDGAVNKAMKNNWRDRVKPLLETLSDNNLGHDQKYHYLAHVVIPSMANKTTFAHFFKGAPRAFSGDKWQHNKAKYPLICRQLEYVFDLIDGIKAHQYHRQTAIIKYCLAFLEKDVASYLATQGQVTYDRIIQQLYAILNTEHGSDHQPLSDAIRSQYSVALIDEFQDTDPYQWHIFKWLFLQAENSHHRLWVIGDPKQSIYGFRGADVHTYYQARQFMCKAGARGYRLNTNYRSIAPLIHAFNHFFTAQADSDSPAYWYQDEAIRVAAADRSANPTLPQLKQDNSGLSAFNYIPLESGTTADSRRRELAEHIADTIETRLVGRLAMSADLDTRILNYDDICILVRANSDSDIIKKACQARQIPVSIQKSRGLYQQTEAVAFEAILSAFHQPHQHERVHNALSTLFFNQAYSEPQLLTEAEQETINQQWMQLLADAKSGHWVAVFDWLINGSGTRFQAEKDGDYRRLANLEKIANTLCRYAMQSNADSAELLRYYKKLRLTAAEQDEDEQNQDTDQQAVNVMTMHGAKGLEFPVVFIFDGLTGERDKAPYHKFYHDDKQATVYDISKQSDELQKKTFHQEFKQLYYVAITRAIYKVFLPFITADNRNLSDNYQQLIVSNIIQCEQSNIEQAYQPRSLTAGGRPGPDLSDSEQSPVTLVPFSQGPENLSARSRFMYSFSSLSQQLMSDSSTLEDRHFGEAQTANDEATDSDFMPAEAPLIPGGVTTGHVLHGVFEHVDFSAVISHDNLSGLWSDNDIMSVVDDQMLQFKLINRPIQPENTDRTQAVDYRQQMAAWVWHTLKKPLPMLNGQSLGMIKADDRRHEMAFLWQHRGQQLTGYIDLLFRIDNGQGGHDYFILDWKSNLNAAGYAPDVLAETVMQQHHYDFQYQIYAAAVDAWFQHLQLDKACLKGALYVFSRGINCHSDDLQGVFYQPFTDLSGQNKKTQQQIMTLTGAKS